MPVPSGKKGGDNGERNKYCNCPGAEAGKKNSAPGNRRKMGGSWRGRKGAVERRKRPQEEKADIAIRRGLGSEEGRKTLSETKGRRSSVVDHKKKKRTRKAHGGEGKL